MNELISVTVVNGRTVTDSMSMSKVFGKRHFDLRKKIHNLEMSNDFRLRNFSHTDIIDEERF